MALKIIFLFHFFCLVHIYKYKLISKVAILHLFDEINMSKKFFNKFSYNEIPSIMTELYLKLNFIKFFICFSSSYIKNKFYQIEYSIYHMFLCQ